MTQSGMEMSEVGANLSAVIDRVRAGEEISITRDGKVLAILVPAEDPERRRALGMFRGQIWMSPDFDEPMSEEELREWGM